MTGARIFDMVELEDRTGYRRAPAAETRRRADAGRITLEGVDGDELENVVTYWWRLPRDDD